MSKHDPYHRLASQLRESRNAAGITQQTLAERLGKPQSFVSKIESGERRIDLVELVNVCSALEMDPREFVDAFLRD
jgi:transcriptional regulator with XRE-family HTH domain